MIYMLQLEGECLKSVLGLTCYNGILALVVYVTIYIYTQYGVMIQVPFVSLKK